jgi:hypothetical protein
MVVQHSVFIDETGLVYYRCADSYWWRDLATAKANGWQYTGILSSLKHSPLHLKKAFDAFNKIK